MFDTNFTADLTIIEEGTELLLRLHRALVKGDATAVLPQFTSCSPGWVKYLEHFYPEYIPNLSTAKSPQQMFGTLLKTYYAELNGLDPEKIVTVALMPCSAKKFECNRPEMCQSGYKDIDYGLTTRELAKMIREAGIELPKMPPSDFDDPFGTATGSGVIFGATGGVMEAALRTVIEIVTGQKVERFFDHANIIPVARLRGRSLRRGSDHHRRARARPAQAPLQRLRVAPRRHAQGGRVPRLGQRQEGDGGHQAPAGSSASATSSSSWPVRAAASAAAASRSPPVPPSAPPGPRPSTPRTAPTKSASRTRTRPSSSSTNASSPTVPAAARATTSCTRITCRGENTSPDLLRILQHNV